MAILLTDAEIAEITDAIRDVTDTFFRKDITLQKRRDDAPIDRFQSDNNLKKAEAYTETVLQGFLSLAGNKTENSGLGSGERSTRGAVDYAEANVSFNFDYLDEQGFIDAELNVLIVPEKDYLKIEGSRYRILSVKKSGQLKDREKLVVCGVRKEEKSNRKDG